MIYLLNAIYFYSENRSKGDLKKYKMKKVKTFCTCREEDPRQRALPEPQQLDDVVEVSWKSVRVRDPRRSINLTLPEPGLTHSKEQRAGEDGGGRPGTGHQHGQHAGPEHQLLR